MVIAKIFERLGVMEGWSVEFGAWDGRQSNTLGLIERGWSGLLIEGDARKFEALSRNVRCERAVLLHATVRVEGPDCLDEILSRAGVPERFDLLSIDIDSDDLAMWRSLRAHRAKCVVIEFNVTIPFDTEFVNSPGKCWGNSALSICGFARSEGYVLVAVSGMNLVFVERDKAEGAGISEIRLGEVEPRERWFWGYDGTLLRAGSNVVAAEEEVMAVPWHAWRMAQPMPRGLRRWELGRQRRRLERLASELSVALRRPGVFISRVARFLKGL